MIEDPLLTLQSHFEGVLASVISQADAAVWHYRAECGRRGDGEWAERLATALEEVKAAAEHR